MKVAHLWLLSNGVCLGRGLTVEAENRIKIAFHAQRIKCILLSISYLNVFCVEKCFVWLKFIDTSNIEGSSDNVTVVN